MKEGNKFNTKSLFWTIKIITFEKILDFFTAWSTTCRHIYFLILVVGISIYSSSYFFNSPH